MNFFDLIELAQLKAIGTAIDPSMESIYRIKCREYSVKYYTPLHLVMELDPLFVLEALYEDLYPPSIVEEEIEPLLEKLYIARDPEYSPLDKQEIEDLVDAVLNREIERKSKKIVPTPENIQKEIKAKEVELPKPKKGGLDFSQLEKLESMSESNSKFED